LCFSSSPAPSLQAADVGIAMGSGSAVAQQASNMVITDDNFCTIVDAIRHGRAIYANIQKFVLFLLGTNSVQIILIMLSVAIGLVLPLSPLSIFFINVGTDGLSSVALSVEKGEDELMTMPPRKKKEPILYGHRLIMLAGHAFGLASGVTAIYVIGLWVFTGHILSAGMRNPDLPTDGGVFNNCSEYVNLNSWRSITHDQCVDGIARARTMVFLIFCAAEILRGFTVRHFLNPIWNGFTTNRAMVYGSLLSFGLGLVFVLSPNARDAFGLTNSLPYFGWLWSLLAVVYITCLDEYIKYRLHASLLEQRRWDIEQMNFTNILNEVRAVNHKLSELKLNQERNQMLDQDASSETQTLLRKFSSVAS
jgi:magnesium-transporting ATPase (P-type)